MPFGLITIPSGSYVYSTPIQLSCPVTLDGTGSTLYYTGKGAAISLGVPGLTPDTRHDAKYHVHDLNIAGGASAKFGIYAFPYTTYIETNDVTFEAFGQWPAGTSTLWYFAGDNWTVRSTNDRGWSGPSNGVYTPSGSTWQGIGIQLHSLGGYGIKANSTVFSVSHGEVAGIYGGGILIGSGSYINALVDDMAMEVAAGDSHGCIGYGGDVDDGIATVGLQVRSVRCNMHQQFGGTGSLLFPRNPHARLVSASVTGNYVNNLRPGSFIVRENDDVKNTDNTASGNSYDIGNGSLAVTRSVLHNIVSNVWYGKDGRSFAAN